MVVVDTEEEFDWSKPLSRSNTQTSAMVAQSAAHDIFSEFGAIPTYVIDYPVATSEIGVKILADLLATGECDIGAHLHPWVNPPNSEAITPHNSYPGNLPAELEREKLAILSDAIENNLGVRPRVYKAGRYGIGPNTAQILEESGYDIDLSVVPFTSFAADGGPDFRSFGPQPYWFGTKRRLLEIPLTCGFSGAFVSSGPNAYPRLSSDFGMRCHLPGLAARLRLLERIRLTPEGADHTAHRRLLNSMMSQGYRVFTLSYHSPSLQPGKTPYVRDRKDLETFLTTIKNTLSYFTNELGGRITTPQSFLNVLNANRE